MLLEVFLLSTSVCVYVTFIYIYVGNENLHVLFSSVVLIKSTKVEKCLPVIHK